MSNEKENQNRPVAVAVAVPLVTAFSSIPMAYAIPDTSPWATKQNCMPPGVYNILASTTEFTIREQIKLAPEYCFGCPPCLRAGKSYYISAGMDASGTNLDGMLFRADEVSEPWNRCCCHPSTPWKMEFRQYIPMPGEMATSEMGIWGQDFQQNFSAMSLTAKGSHVKDKYAALPVAFTAVRDGTQCCCCNGCHPWLCNKMLCGSCPACCDCCLDGTTVLAGETTEAEPAQIGSVDPSNPAILGFSKVPCLGGCLTPTLHMSKTPFPNENPWAKIQGPTCFGGCSELCCDFHFPVSTFAAEDKVGDLAMIQKRRPRGGAAAMRELLTDADVFTISLNAKMSPEEKALVLGNQILLDYMFFEGGNDDKCGQTADGRGCFINLCNMYCFGCVVPCHLEYSPSSGDS